MSSREWMRVDEVARKYFVSESTLYKRTRNGTIESKTMQIDGRKFKVISRRDVESMFEPRSEIESKEGKGSDSDPSSLARLAYAGVVTGVAGTLAASFLSWLRQHSGSSKDDDVETALLRFDEKFVRGETAKQQYERSVRKKATAAVATLGGTAVAAKSSKASVCDTVTAKVNDRKTGISAKGQESNLPSIYKPEVARIVSSIDRIKERREECTKWFSEQMSALKPSVFWTPSPDDYERVFKKHNRKRQKIDADAEWIEKRAARALAEIQFFVDCATVPEIEPISRYLEQCDVERKAAEELRKKYAALEDKRRQNLKERQQYGKPPFMCGDGPIGRNLW